MVEPQPLESKSMRTRVIRADGTTENSVSTYCPDCGHHKLEKDVDRSSDFDENGHFYWVKLTCQNTRKCGKSWQEKIVTASGNFFS